MLKKLIFALSVSTALSIPALSYAATISESITRALSTHPQMKAGEASREQADRNIREQKSGFFPTISLNADAGRLRNNDKTTRANTSNDGAASWMGEGTVRLTQPIFDGFGTLNKYHSAQNHYSAVSYDLGGTAEEVTIRAARTHLNLMRTKELLSLASKFLSDIESRRQKIALMVKGGAADEAELLQADEIRTIVKNARLGYEEDYRQAEADYIEIAGSMPETALEFGDSKWNNFIPPTLDEAVTHGVNGNPHILAASKRVASSQEEVGAEKSSLVPRLDAEVSYMKQDQLDVVGGEMTSAQAMLKLAWNFSIGGGQIARIERYQQRGVETAAKRQGIIRTVERDIRQKYASMQIIDQQLALLTERDEASKKILENFTAQFEGGKQSNLQLIAANSKVFDAGTALTDVRYRQLLSRFELLNAMGMLRDAFGIAKTGASQKG